MNASTIAPIMIDQLITASAICVLSILGCFFSFVLIGSTLQEFPVLGEVVIV